MCNKALGDVLLSMRMKQGLIIFVGDAYKPKSQDCYFIISKDDKVFPAFAFFPVDTTFDPSPQPTFVYQIELGLYTELWT